MKIFEASILGLPSNYQLLLLCQINLSDYCAVILPKESQKSSNEIIGAEIAIGKNEEDLFFAPVDTFFIYNDFYNSWLLKSGELVKLQGIQKEVYLGDEHTPLKIIFSDIF